MYRQNTFTFNNMLIINTVACRHYTQGDVKKKCKVCITAERSIWFSFFVCSQVGIAVRAGVVDIHALFHAAGYQTTTAETSEKNTVYIIKK